MGVTVSRSRQKLAWIAGAVFLGTLAIPLLTQLFGGQAIFYNRIWLTIAGISFLATLAGLDVGSEGTVPLYKRSIFWAMAVGAVFSFLVNVIFW